MKMNMNKFEKDTFFYEGKEINIRETRSEDIPIWYKWFNNPEVNKTLVHGVIPNTIELQEEFRNKHLNGENGKVMFSIVSKENNNLIGTCSLNLIGPSSVRRCEISIVIGDLDSHQGSVYIETTLWQIKHAFNNMNMNSIFAATSSDNKPVMLTLERIGFKKCGTTRHASYKDGEYKNGALYDLLKSEWINT
jgi:RimJ/RimL family protein N-acetyltransferase